ncbi:MAG: hypothetical protein CL848_04830 [Crocinitomicaceae bacterium]|nr:hypothetical protein [Crocinitomicaceae bacterium]
MRGVGRPEHVADEIARLGARVDGQDVLAPGGLVALRLALRDPRGAAGRDPAATGERQRVQRVDEHQARGVRSPIGVAVGRPHQDGVGVLAHKLVVVVGQAPRLGRRLVRDGRLDAGFVGLLAQAPAGV